MGNEFRLKLLKAQLRGGNIPFTIIANGAKVDNISVIACAKEGFNIYAYDRFVSYVESFVSVADLLKGVRNE